MHISYKNASPSRSIQAEFTTLMYIFTATGAFFTELSEPLDEDDENSQQSPHPANIKLKRVGYFTVPSLLELAEMTDENGHCEVRTFTIGRENYGTIFFEGPLDVSNLNLDDLGKYFAIN
jgi:nuclear pore complex protein Nup98-Nup96